jgi:hypothetical protein
MSDGFLPAQVHHFNSNGSTYNASLNSSTGPSQPQFNSAYSASLNPSVGPSYPQIFGNETPVTNSTWPPLAIGITGAIGALGFIFFCFMLAYFCRDDIPAYKGEGEGEGGGETEPLTNIKPQPATMSTNPAATQPANVPPMPKGGNSQV